MANIRRWLRGEFDKIRREVRSETERGPASHCHQQVELSPGHQTCQPEAGGMSSSSSISNKSVLRIFFLSSFSYLFHFYRLRSDNPPSVIVWFVFPDKTSLLWYESPSRSHISKCLVKSSPQNSGETFSFSYPHHQQDKIMTIHEVFKLSSILAPS